MRIRIANRHGRYRTIGGYGMLARQIILGLADLGHDVSVEASDAEWEDIEPHSAERIRELPTWSRDRRTGADLVLQIGPLQGARSFKLPTLLYTQHALNRLPVRLIPALEAVGGAIVPSAYDERIFARELERVWIANQSSSPKIFKPRTDWRSEGSSDFTFMFVGSYSWRKGVDLLLRAFLEEFDPDEPVRLLMYCVGAGELAFNHLLDTLQSTEPRGKVRLSSRKVSPEWMCRYYNRADAVITLSRGEGWCMPATEALLCEKPVIAPASTAFLDYLDPSIAQLVPTRDVPLEDVEGEFARSWIDAWGEPGIVAHEPELGAARAAMREVVTNPESQQEAARRGAERIRQEITWNACARRIETACSEFLGREGKRR